LASTWLPTQMQSQMQLQQRELGQVFIASWAAMITESHYERQCGYPEHELQRLRGGDLKCK
jgi:hypothetical protein